MSLIALGEAGHAVEVALYTGLRPGELRAHPLARRRPRCQDDLDLEGHRRHDGGVKPPKTVQGHRIIPILPELHPLLKAIEGEPEAPVLPLAASEDHTAARFRAYLEAADVKRTRLSADNGTEEPIDFRSLRDTHATWLALAGVSDKIIQRRMGHAS